MAISLQRLHLKREFEGYLLMASLVYVHLILRSSSLKEVMRCVPGITTAFREVIKIGKGFVRWLTYLHNPCMWRFS
jgi:hypothetical protein